MVMYMLQCAFLYNTLEYFFLDMNVMLLVAGMWIVIYMNVCMYIYIYIYILYAIVHVYMFACVPKCTSTAAKALHNVHSSYLCIFGQSLVTMASHFSLQRKLWLVKFWKIIMTFLLNSFRASFQRPAYTQKVQKGVLLLLQVFAVLWLCCSTMIVLQYYDRVAVLWSCCSTMIVDVAKQMGLWWIQAWICCFLSMNQRVRYTSLLPRTAKSSNWQFPFWLQVGERDLWLSLCHLLYVIFRTCVRFSARVCVFAHAQFFVMCVCACKMAFNCAIMLRHLIRDPATTPLRGGDPWAITFCM